jgi:L-fucose mutarotase
MALVPGETYKPEIRVTYRAICKKQEYFTDFESVERFAFYERAKKAHAVIATSETALYANIIPKKA